MPNFHHKQPPLQDNQKVDRYYCSQLQPHTPIGEGVTGLVFTNSNLMNCLLPEDAVVGDGCNTAQIDFCFHKHPEFNLPVEDDNCRHVTDSIDVDGLIIYIREDIKIG